MKSFVRRLILLGLAVCLLPALALAADAAEVDASVLSGGKAVDTAVLRDGSADTGCSFKSGKAATVTIRLPEGSEARRFFVQLKAAPASVTLRQKNSSGKFQEIASVKSPASQLVLDAGRCLTGEVMLEISGVKKSAVMLQELRVFTDGDLPGDVHAFADQKSSDVLYIIPSAAEADGALLASLTESGRTVQVLCMARPADVNAFANTLWDAGVNRYPIYGDLQEMAADAPQKTVENALMESSVVKTIACAVRQAQPQVIIHGGQGEDYARITALMDQAAASAADSTYELDNAAEFGLWAVNRVYAAGSAEAAEAIANWQDEGSAALRALCAAKFEDAQHGDASSIPYPARLEDGYLSEGEFVWEDPENGLWAYLSPTLQIEIIRYEQPDIPRSWFVSDIRFKPEAESFHQQVYVNATFPGQMIYPETLAQTARLVFGVNSDYYIFRKETKTTGNIIRDGQVLFNYKKGSGFPNLDTMALHADGSVSVYAAGEISADALLAEGDVHDALSFGPYLVRDGRMRLWNGKNSGAKEPRTAVGMVEPGHLKVITVEGRFKSGYGPAGVTLNTLAEMLYAEGVTDALNLDGGNTAVLIFMGEKLNRTASKSGKGETEPRNMDELFGIGYSELVVTE